MPGLRVGYCKPIKNISGIELVRHPVASNEMQLGQKTKILEGKNTQVFRRSTAKKTPEANCFTLASDGKEFNIECTSPQVREAWVVGLRAAIEQRFGAQSPQLQGGSGKAAGYLSPLQSAQNSPAGSRSVSRRGSFESGKRPADDDVEDVREEWVVSEASEAAAVLQMLKSAHLDVDLTPPQSATDDLLAEADLN
jgi:hypothetical protein